MTIQVNLTAHCHEDYTMALTAHLMIMIMMDAAAAALAAHIMMIY